MSPIARQGKNPKADDLKKVTKELLYQCGDCFAVRVQKLIFYSDMYCTERYNKRLTQADFKPTMYGGYAEDIRDALDELEKEGIPTTTGTRKGRITTRYMWEEETDLEEGRKEVIADVCEVTESVDTESLTRLSKRNWLFENTEYDAVMDFAKYREALEEGEAEPVTVKQIGTTEEENVPQGLFDLEASVDIQSDSNYLSE